MSRVPSPDRDSRYVLTGPGGWIGSAYLAWFAANLGPAWPDRVSLYGSSARELTAPDGSKLWVRGLEDVRAADVDGAVVIHLAYLTKEKVEALGDQAFLAGNLGIDERLLSALSDGRPRGVFVASSGAAAQAEAGVDRHLYGMAKLMQEDRFLAWGREAGVPVLAGRIWNLAGPYMNKLESYALSSFLVQALQTGRIRVAAAVPVYRSYLHVGDLCALTTAVLAGGRAPETAVDLCGSLVVEMQDVAEAAAAATGLPPSAVERDSIDYARPSVYLGAAFETRSLAFASGVRLRDFAAQVADTAADLRERSGRVA